MFDASAAGLPDGANIDALLVVDEDTFYMSFNADLGTVVPGGVGTVQDEDIVHYDGGTWSLFFDGSLVGLGDADDEDVDALELLPDGRLVISTVGGVSVPGLNGTHQDEDLLVFTPTIPECIPQGAGQFTSMALISAWMDLERMWMVQRCPEMTNT